MCKLQQTLKKYAIRVTLALDTVPNKLLLYYCIVRSAIVLCVRADHGVQFTIIT
jgi:hypothetical protein